jgi:hypothetical protein
MPTLFLRCTNSQLDDSIYLPMAPDITTLASLPDASISLVFTTALFTDIQPGTPAYIVSTTNVFYASSTSIPVRLR